MRKTNAMALFGFLLLIVGGFVSAGGPVKVSTSSVADQDKVWVIVKPLQCMDNPWEQAWIAAHKKKSIAYPRQEERRIIKEFFAGRGVQVWDIRNRPYIAGTPLCKTCGCHRGDTLYLSVNASDAPLMKSFGYDRLLPDDTTNH